MNLSEILLLGIRWLHNIAAVAWVGGGIFYLLILRPRMGQIEGQHSSLGQAIGEEFRALVNVAIVVLIVTGTVLIFDRLAGDFVRGAYVAALAAKIAIASYMFYLVRFLRRRTYPDNEPEVRGSLRYVASICTGATAILILGLVVLLISDVLRQIFEHGLAI